MDRLADLEVFVAIVEAGSLAGAARQLERSTQAVSRSLAAVERGVGATLIQRTTRRMAVTPLGEAFYRRVKPALEELRTARLEAAEERGALSGSMTVTAPVLFGASYAAPVIARFMQEHPALTVDLRLSDRFVDLAAENVDVAIRIGNLPDSELKARKLGVLRLVYFGTPDYFARHGRPMRPEELQAHQCVLRHVEANDARWPYAEDGRVKRVRVAGRFRTDHTAAMYAAVRAGLGIGFTPYWQIKGEVEKGAFELLLTAFEPPPVPVHIVWPPAPFPVERTRALIDALAASIDLSGL